MNKLTLLGALALPAALASCASSSSEAKQPNVIVILADDLGYGDMSAYGSKTISTPNLDMLANNGIRFTDGHATSATSTPSRYALFTGQYPWRAGARILPGDAPLIIKEEQYTMPKMFRAAGYTTAAIGKWHLGMGAGNLNWNETIKPGANEIGFDYSCLIAATNDRVPTVYVENGDVVGLDKNDPIEVNYKTPFEGEPNALNNPEMIKMNWSHGHNNAIVNGIPRIGYMRGGKSALWVDEDMADYFVGKVADFIDSNKRGDKPFFLYYGLHQPHVPRAPHSRFVGSTNMGPRGDAIIEADWCIGELIAKLEKEGLMDNTIIFFSSDNGPVLNDGYKDNAVELLGDHTPAGELRGGKYSLFDGGTRVPFFIYWKGQIKPMVSDALVSQLDLFASFASMLGQELPEGLDSRNELDKLLGKSTEDRDGYVVEATSRLAYRKGNYALIPPYRGPAINLTKTETGTSMEYSLYDLDKDPGQKDNLVKKQPELFESIKAEFLAEVGSFYKSPTAPAKNAKK